MKQAKHNQRTYFIIGVLLTGIGIYVNSDAFLNNRFPDAIMLLALGISQLFLSYLSPHLFPKDERAKAIMGKAMTVNYFVLFGAMLFLFLLTGASGPFTLNSTQVLQVLFCIMVIAIPGTMVIYSKRL
ncbi:hypothetical protein [Priestia koreensis]|uniref:hypothetical protein n=1 Tax=Priestia koreensis TaxID=284581 RepID=UPI001F57B4D6|nr:hypothetical protein [Priestia koreensis]UNL83183.1 hypothetical protein IE339_13375 [Priestia koreensis]